MGIIVADLAAAVVDKMEYGNWALAPGWYAPDVLVFKVLWPFRLSHGFLGNPGFVEGLATMVEEALFTV